MFLCDSTDARRSGLALSGYWDGRVGAEAAGAGFLRLSQQMSAALEGKEVRTVSNRRVAAIHLLQAPLQRFKVNLRCSGSRRKIAVWGKEAFITCSRSCPVFTIWSSIKLHFNGGFLAPRRPVRCWNMMHLFYYAGKNVPSSSWKCKNVPPLPSHSNTYLILRVWKHPQVIKKSRLDDPVMPFPTTAPFSLD